MAKEFDIFLNKHLTECDLIIYSLPYHDGIAVMNRLILESYITNYALQKLIAVQNGIEPNAQVDQTFKTSYLQVGSDAILDADAAFDVHYIMPMLSNPIAIDTQVDGMLATGFIAADSNLVIDTAPVIAFAWQYLYCDQAGIPIGAEIENTLKKVFVRGGSPMILGQSDMETESRKNITVDAPVLVSAAVKGLFDRVPLMDDTVAKLGIGIGTSTLRTKLRSPFGSVFNGIAIDTGVSGTNAQKYVTIDAPILPVADIVWFSHKSTGVEPSKLLLGFTAEGAVKRYRFLNEMDENSLLEYDDLPLDEVDFVYLS